MKSIRKKITIIIILLLIFYILTGCVHTFTNIKKCKKNQKSITVSGSFSPVSLSSSNNFSPLNFNILYRYDFSDLFGMNAGFFFSNMSNDMSLFIALQTGIFFDPIKYDFPFHIIFYGGAFSGDLIQFLKSGTAGQMILFPNIYLALFYEFTPSFSIYTSIAYSILFEIETGVIIETTNFLIRPFVSLSNIFINTGLSFEWKF